MGREYIVNLIRGITLDTINERRETSEECFKMEVIGERTDFVEDLNCDSFDLRALITSFEDEFEFDISDEDLERLKTVGDVVTYVMNYYGQYVKKNPQVV